MYQLCCCVLCVVNTKICFLCVEKIGRYIAVCAGRGLFTPATNDHSSIIMKRRKGEEERMKKTIRKKNVLRSIPINQVIRFDRMKAKNTKYY